MPFINITTDMKRVASTLDRIATVLELIALEYFGIQTRQTPDTDTSGMEPMYHDETLAFFDEVRHPDRHTVYGGIIPDSHGDLFSDVLNDANKQKRSQSGEEVQDLSGRSPDREG